MLKTFLNRCSRFSRMASGALVLAALASCGGGDPVPNTSTTASAAAPQLRDKAQAAASNFTGNGWYWDAAAGGTGMMFEAQGDAGFLGVFLYEADGRPVWYVASGAFALDGAGYRFTGELRRYQDGQTLTGPWRQPTSTAVGAITVNFTGTGTDTRASMMLPGGRAWNVERFNFGGINTPPAPNQPEAGWYWKATEGGRGYAIEVQGERVFMAMFHYSADGQPVWHVTEGKFDAGVMPSANMNLYRNGQVLAGPYKEPTFTRDGGISLGFSRACGGWIKPHDSADWTQVDRFTFGVAQACRTSQTPSPFGGNLVVDIAEPSYPPLSEERKAFNTLNTNRGRCGFGLLSQNPLLDQAAENHRAYMVRHGTFGHEETPGSLGYTGTMPPDRTDAVGYGRLSSESVTGAFPSTAVRGETEISKLLAAPYHERDLIESWSEVGFGYSTEASALGVGMFVAALGESGAKPKQNATGVRSFPCAGVSNVAWSSTNESPTPFPGEAAATWGQPVIVRGDKEIRITSESITGPAGPVSIKVVYGEGREVDPNTRCNGNTTCIIPVALSAASTYQVKIAGTNGGTPFTRTFSFSTR